MKKLFIFFLLFSSCLDQKPKEEVYVDNSPPLNRNDIILKDNYYTLLLLFTNYLNQNKPIYELLPEAFYVAEIDGDPFSYQLIYLGTLNKYDKIDDIYENHVLCYQKLKKTEKEMVLKYLEKGAEQKDHICVSYLIGIYSSERNYDKVKHLQSIEVEYESIIIE